MPVLSAPPSAARPSSVLEYEGKDYYKQREKALKTEQKYSGRNVYDWYQQDTAYQNFANPIATQLKTQAVQQLADLQSGKLSASLLEPVRAAAEAGQRQYQSMTGTRAGSLAAGAAAQSAAATTGALIASQKRAELLDMIHRGLTARDAIL